MTKIFVMKKTLLFFVILCAVNHVRAQDYIDVIKVAYSSTQLNYAAENAKSQMSGFDVALMTPISIAPSSHLLVGGDFHIRNLGVSNSIDNSSFYNTIARLGVSKTFNESWNGYLLALPKFASDYNNNFGSSFLMGGLAMLKHTQGENLTWKFGLYGSQEAYGFFGTPLLGIFYRSADERLTIDAGLPLLADANYTLNTKKTTSVGLDFVAIRRSFYMGPNVPSQLYVENNEISFTPYVQYAALDSKLLLRLKAGYSTADFGLYAVNDDKMVGISALNIGDNRTRLNQDIRGGLQVKIEATIRIGTKR